MEICAHRPYWMAQNLGDLLPYGPGLEKMGHHSNRGAGRYPDHAHSYAPGSDSRDDTSQHHDIPDGRQRIRDTVLVTAQQSVSVSSKGFTHLISPSELGAPRCHQG
jgi:hypothetical protein